MDVVTAGLQDKYPQWMLTESQEEASVGHKKVGRGWGMICRLHHNPALENVLLVGPVPRRECWCSSCSARNGGSTPAGMGDSSSLEFETSSCGLAGELVLGRPSHVKYSRRFCSSDMSGELIVHPFLMSHKCYCVLGFVFFCVYEQFSIKMPTRRDHPCHT